MQIHCGSRHALQSWDNSLAFGTQVALQSLCLGIIIIYSSKVFASVAQSKLKTKLRNEVCSCQDQSAR